MIILVGGAFIYVGVQSVRGTAKDTLGNGIGSIVFAAFQFCGAALSGLALLLAPGGVAAVVFAVGLIDGAGLLTTAEAGIANHARDVCRGGVLDLAGPTLPLGAALLRVAPLAHTEPL